MELVMRESMYTDQYLDGNESERQYTPSTFLVRTLHGKAKSYSGGYYTSLMRSLKAREALGMVRRVVSIGGREAWVRVTSGEAELLEQQAWTPAP